MYLDYWDLREFPFENVPDPKFMYFSQDFEEALIRLLYAVERKKGAALLSGEVGCGKTTLSRVLIKRLSESAADISLITNPSLEPIDFLKEILYQFGINPGPGVTKADLLNLLNTRMLENLREEKTTLLIIDEAQVISNDTFEEVRLLLNFQMNNQMLLTLILIGQPELRNIIREIKQLDQRIAIKYHLPPLSLDDTTNYITSRLRTAGSRKDIYTADALNEIYRNSLGIPRTINNICDLSLMIGFVSKARVVDYAIVKKVVNDLSAN
jgi:type II secretory pathway predicted ATPase ExeA